MYQYQTKFKQVIRSFEEMEKFEKENILFNLIKNILDNLDTRRWTVNAGVHLPFIKRTVSTICKGLNEQKDFLLCTDYDVDWMLSGLELYSMISLLNAAFNKNSKCYLRPSTRDEWYGLTHQFFESKEYDNIWYVMTTDLWISVEFPKEFISKKEKIIVFDHHTPITNIYLSIKEFKERWLAKHPDFVISKKSFSSQGEQMDFLETLKEFMSEDPCFNEKFVRTFIANNYTLNSYSDYYKYYVDFLEEYRTKTSAFDEWANGVEFKLNKELWETVARMWMSEIWQSSAWELASSILELLIDKLVATNYLSKKAKKLIDLHTVYWGITAISDVTKLESCNNLWFVLKSKHLMKELRILYNKHKEKKWAMKLALCDYLGINNVNSLFWNHFPSISDNQINHMKDYLNQLSNFFEWLMQFEFTTTGIWFSIAPTINAYGRMSIPHFFFTRILTWEDAIKGCKSYNSFRKEIQKKVQEVVMNDIEDNPNIPIAVWGCIESDFGKFWKEYDEETVHKAYQNIKKFFNTKFPQYFIWDTTDLSESQILQEEEKMLINKEWVIWLVANKIQNILLKPAIVWVYQDVSKNSLKGSWRSALSLFDLKASTFQSVNSIWGHKEAFGISINNKKLFIEEFEKALEGKNIEELYTVYSDALFVLKDDVNYLNAIKKLLVIWEWFFKTLSIDLHDFKDWNIEAIKFMGETKQTIKIILQKDNKKIELVNFDYKPLFKRLGLPLPKWWQETEIVSTWKTEEQLQEDLNKVDKYAWNHFKNEERIKKEMENFKEALTTTIQPFSSLTNGYLIEWDQSQSKYTYSLIIN